MMRSAYYERAYTPAEAKAVRAIAQTFRASKGVDTARAITDMGIGEALISIMDQQGVPTPVVRAKVKLPVSPSAPLDELERVALIRRDPLRQHYGRRFATDQGAYEAFLTRLEAQEAAAAASRTKSLSWHEEESIESVASSAEGPVT
ncbi:helicase HerA-like domain-containing protein [Bosea sp. LjRoot237]|uniref:helicase HerA-like domain-containing protein n=1 Tax=Bosea sp. LjRoot237 TaxID=3342292 RepID=UPI003F507F8B